MTGRRNVRKRLRELDGEGSAAEWPESVEIAGVPATELGDDGFPIEDDEDASHGRGEEAETITLPIPPADEDDDEGGPDAPEDREECPECGVNPIEPRLDGALCLACHGLPRRDWPPYLVDPDGEEGGT